MTRKNTNQLLHELMDTNDLHRVLTENDASFREDGLTDALQRLFEERSMAKTTLAKSSGISEVYLHQVFSGRRCPRDRRDAILIYGLSHRLTLPEVNDALFRGNLEALC